MPTAGFVSSSMCTVPEAENPLKMILASPSVDLAITGHPLVRALDDDALFQPLTVVWKT